MNYVCESRDAKCPFHNKHDTKKCEIFCDGNPEIILRFKKNVKRMREFERLYCNDVDGYKNCDYAKAIAKEYGGF